MKKLTLISIVSLIGWTAHAGDNGGGVLVCTSDSGRTKVQGAAGADYNGNGPAELVFEIDGAQLVLNPNLPHSAKTQFVDFVSYSHGSSYEVVIKSSTRDVYQGEEYVRNDEVFRLRSLKGTMKQTNKQDVYKFKAVIPAYSSVDPRSQSNLDQYADKFAKDIVMNCTLDVSI